MDPLQLHESVVLPDWIDYNGHMNVAFYVLAFDQATDAFLDHIGLDHGYKNEANCTTFVVDMNVCYLGEVLEGDPLRFTTQLINSDEKRLHYFHRMYHAEKGYLAATNELMTVHISPREPAGCADARRHSGPRFSDSGTPRTTAIPRTSRAADRH